MLTGKSNVIERHVTVIEYDADNKGVTLNGAMITWDEWFTLMGDVMAKQPKKQIQLHIGWIIPSDWVNGAPAKPEDIGREITTLETITMDIMPEYRQVVEGVSKYGDLYWRNGWEKVTGGLVDRRYHHFQRLMRRI